MHEKCVAHHAEIRKMVTIHLTRADKLESASRRRGRATIVDFLFLLSSFLSFSSRVSSLHVPLLSGLETAYL